MPIKPVDTSDAESSGGRREHDGTLDTRGRGHLFWDLLFATIRRSGGVAKNFYATFGIFLSAGAALAIAGTYAFAKSPATPAAEDGGIRRTRC